MLRTNPSPFEKPLSNSPHLSNECFTRGENPKNKVAMLSQLIVRVKDMEAMKISSKNIV